MMRNLLVALIATLLLVQACAFAPSKAAFRVTSLAKSTPKAAFVLRMADEDTPSGETAEAPKISADGTFYDDELDSAPKKQGLSDDMRARLMAEASTGLDSNSRQTNVLLYIIAGVAVLVVLGGKGIFY